jgi:hypothetical protein
MESFSKRITVDVPTTRLVLVETRYGGPHLVTVDDPLVWEETLQRLDSQGIQYSVKEIAAITPEELATVCILRRSAVVARNKDRR